MTATLRDMTFDLNPVNDSSLSPVVTFMRNAFRALVLGLYLWWLWAEVEDSIKSCLAAQQAKGNAVLGGTGGQATALVAAGLITAALLAVPTVVFALRDNSLSLGATGLGSLGMAGSAVAFLNQFVPLTEIMASLTSVWIVKKGKVAQILLVSGIIRFIVPAFAIFLWLGSPVRSDASVVVVNNDSNAIHYVSGSAALEVPSMSSEVFDGYGSFTAIFSDGKRVVGWMPDDGTIMLVGGVAVPEIPPSVWIAYLTYGFVVGMTWELVGMATRMVRQIKMATGEGL
jgi:hypothetical protein